jgi:mitochondrial GTPase 1
MKPSPTFIPRSIFPDYNVVLANFLGHHRSALNKMAGIASQVDMVLELRDSRVPLSSINGLFDRFLLTKQKLILYSKNDLSNIDARLLEKWHSFDNSQYIQIDCRSKRDASRVLNLVKAFHKEVFPPPPLGMRLLITGMPNAGKSTFLNTIRSVGMQENHKVARTGGEPGITRSVSNIICICRDPDIFIYDSPGVFVPRTKDTETMLKMSIVGAVNKARVDPIIQADYLLFHLNKTNPDGRDYKKYLERPTNQIYRLLKGIAAQRGVLKKNGSFDEKGMALFWLDNWKKGYESALMLDETTEDAYLDVLREQRDMYQDFDIDISRQVRYNKRKMLRM